jgi:hypothetical protein
MYHLSHTPKHALTIGYAATLGRPITTVNNITESENLNGLDVGVFGGSGSRKLERATYSASIILNDSTVKLSFTFCRLLSETTPLI